MYIFSNILGTKLVEQKCNFVLGDSVNHKRWDKGSRRQVFSVGEGVFERLGCIAVLGGCVIQEIGLGFGSGEGM
jgi:hypothetical protein